MSANDANNPQGKSGGEKQRRKRFGERPLWARIGIVAAWVVGGAVILAASFLCAITWLLTPDRLTGIINREASSILKADVKVWNARFTIWSTFPRFCIEIDSLRVTSRTLRDLPPDVRAKLPADADFLASSGHLRGGINITGLLASKILLRDVHAEHLNLNLVAVSDSVANYYIWPTLSDNTEVPYFRARSVLLDNPGQLRFFSLASGADVNVALSAAQLRETAPKGNSYRMELRGDISARVGRLTVLTRFPFSLGGTLNLRFKPFGIRAENYAVNLGNLSGKVDMDVEVGQDVRLNRFSYKLDNFNLNKLLRYLPPDALPYLSRLNADLTVNASARLTTAYNFSSSKLPSAQVDFSVPDGLISYTLSDGRTYSLRHVGAGGSLVFDGNDPAKSYFSVPEFHLEGEGADLAVAARVTDLMGDPSVEADIRGNASLARLGTQVAELAPYRLRGTLGTDCRLRFRISDMRRGDFENIAITGDVNLDNASASAPGMNLALGSFDIDFGGEAGELTNSYLARGLLSFTATGSDLVMKMGHYTLRGDSINISSSLSDKRPLRFATMLRSIPYDVKVRAANVTLANPHDTVGLRVRGVTLDGTVLTTPDRLVARRFDMRVRGGAVSFEGASLKADVRGVALDVQADALGSPLKVKDFIMPEAWMRDSLFASGLPHSPMFIQARLPRKATDLMARWRLASRLRVASGSLSAKAFPSRTRISGLDLSASTDSLRLRSLRVASQSTAASISARVSGLRQFLASRTPAPLRASLDIAFDTIQCNQLAATYERGAARSGSNVPKALKDPKDPKGSNSSSLSDTTAMLIPRNLQADIRLSALLTKYMDLRFYNLGADISTRDGNLDIRHLGISADFGRAALTFAYRTSDIERLSMQAGVKIADVQLTHVYQNFPSILAMMPEMKNLEGTLAADCRGHLLIFPSMYADIPSLMANMHVTGRGLTVHQNAFIRRITKMMLIHTAADLHIANMDVHASVHDNLLELYPFNFSFDRYRLRMGGVNNFDGELYYHIGVNKSPVPFPFGIEIEGMFHHPKLRFGGASYKIDKGARITASVMEENRLNLVKEFKYYLKELVSAAARSDVK